MSNKARSTKDVAAERLVRLQGHLTNGEYHEATGPRDLAAERARGSFDVVDMESFFNGGEEAAEYRRQAYQIIRRDPELLLPDELRYNSDQNQLKEKTMQQIRRYVEVSRNVKNPKLRQALYDAMSIYSEMFGMRIYVHEMLFNQSLIISGSNEQHEEWKDLIETWGVIGCYAMTELGHSSFLRGLETTATFDKVTDEFVIHSPTLTATKWWIGMAGETATHTVAIAQLIIDGKSYGVQWFIVQLRDRSTGRLMPGVIAGNIGSKAGRGGLDNGWIQFNHVRIPRKHMLRRWADVSREGIFTPSPNPSLAYAALIPERLAVIPGTVANCGQALTIATRYSCVRRQGNNDELIMDYQTQQVRLMPGIASLYVFNILSTRLNAHWSSMTALINTQPEVFLGQLADIHASSAGFKAMVGWWGSEILERCRRACGGHAFSAYNAIPGIIGDWGVMTTGGGDNIVLAQQTARYLVSCIKKISMGKRVEGTVAYFNDIPRLLQSKSCSLASKDLISIEGLLDILTWLSAQQMITLGQALASAAGGNTEAAWQQHQTELVDASLVYSRRTALHVFVDYLQEMEKISSHYIHLVPVLRRCGLLYALQCVQEQLAPLLELGYLSAEQSATIRRAFLDACADLRKDAVPLVDSWGFPDFIIKAPIGRYDGNIYPAYLDRLRHSDDCFGVPKYWEQYIKPLTFPKKDDNQL
ncbi:hypothetical protein BDF19DRAFT_423262 [Syncephalis fuscata]|nr:hypothetical protein BDF19DRAFT_423262 [Syncephalis fuscata]